MSETETETNVPSESAKDPKGEPITIRVRGQDGQEIFFKIKENTKMVKMMKAYTDRIGVHTQSVRYLFNGQRVCDDDTPKMLDMENDDVIDVMIEQVGGY